MNSLFMIVELILAVFLERTTRKNSKNSSLPPSQTDKDESALKGSRSKGKRVNRQRVQNARIVETVTLNKVSSCEVCGKPLTDVPFHHHERRAKIDIVFEKVVEHVDVEVKQCPRRQTTVKGRFPAVNGHLKTGWIFRPITRRLVRAMTV